MRSATGSCSDPMPQKSIWHASPGRSRHPHRGSSAPAVPADLQGVAVQRPAGSAPPRRAGEQVVAQAGGVKVGGEADAHRAWP